MTVYQRAKFLGLNPTQKQLSIWGEEVSKVWQNETCEFSSDRIHVSQTEEYPDQLFKREFGVWNYPPDFDTEMDKIILRRKRKRISATKVKPNA